MNKHHKRRLWVIAFFSIGLGLASTFIFYALKQNINVFVTPTDALSAETNQRIRLGGMVKPNSLVRDAKSLKVKFVVTDLKHDIAVEYEGILPDLFREGKGAIAEGYLNTQGIMKAKTILAKHDENYTPRAFYSSNKA